MNKIIIKISFLLLMTACGTSRRSSEATTNFLPFTRQVIDTRPDYKDSFKIYEIAYDDIMALSRSSEKKIWIHFFAPWCSSISNKDLEKLEDIEQAHQNNLQLILVSTAYDYSSLKGLLHNSDIRKPVYVLDGHKYGYHIRSSQKELYRQLSMKSGNRYYDDYLIKDGKLLFFKPLEETLDLFVAKIHALDSKLRTTPF